jgi:hypothetical protein
MFVAQLRAHAQVVTLRGFQISGMACRMDSGDARGPHHYGQNARVQHALYRYALGRGLDASDPPDSVNQRRPMVRSGTSYQGAVDIE